MYYIQQDILGLVERENIQTLTLREIGKRLGIVHPQQVKHHIQQLVKKGFLSLNKEKKTVSLVHSGNNDGDSFIRIPILGAANCGIATIVAEERAEGMLMVSRSHLSKLNISELFAVQAVGNSLNRANVDTEGNSIENGDYVLIDKSQKNPENGKFVLSVINGLANIKQFVKDIKNRQIVLLSSSTEAIPPIYIHEIDFAEYMINGTVVKVIKNPVL